MKTFLFVHLIFYSFYNVCYGYEDHTLKYLNLKESEDAHILSLGCQQALKMLSERLNHYDENDDDIWALQMLDSTAKMPTGLLSYNFQELGNYDECIEIESKRDNVMGKYCLADMFVNASTINNPPEYLEKHIYLKSLILRVHEGIQQNGNLKWAFCLPNNCSNEDAIHMINITDELGFDVASVSCQTSEDAFPALDTDGIIGITIFGILIFLVVASTTIDLYYSYIPTVPRRTKRTKQQDKQPLLKPVDNSTEDRNGDLSTQVVKPPDVKPLYVAFSLYSNCKSLIGVPSRPSGLSCLDGLRVISMLWIISLHLLLEYFIVPVINYKDVDKDFVLLVSDIKPVYLSFSAYTNCKRLFGVQSRPSGLSCLDGLRVISTLWIMALHLLMLYAMQPIINPKDLGSYTSQLSSAFLIGGGLGCDTFLLVGGTLVTYVYFIKDKGNQLSSLRGILKYYLHRYIRLMPALLGVIIFTITIFKYMNTGPKWIDGTTEMRETCKEYWWSALLLFQNQNNVDTMCIRHSWYINVDMQLYLISPIILWLLKKYTKTGIFSITVAALFSIGLYFKREYLNEMGAAHSTNPFGIFDNDYFKTETRAAPWLMGTILGYFLTKKEYQNYQISKKYLLPLWILSLTSMILVVLGGQPTTRSTENYVLESALYMALSRPIFALAVAWVIWACATNNGGIIHTFLSLPIFNLLNKFIYSVYLLHLMIINYIMFTVRTPIYFSMFDLAYSYGGFVICSFVVSIFWVLLFESPMMVLEKIILP